MLLILLAGLILELLYIPHAISLSYFVMTVFVFVRGFMIHRMLTGKGKKIQQYSIIGGLILIIVVFSAAMIPTKIKVTENTLDISGSYGVEWKLDEITAIELWEEIPEIERRTNGSSVFDKRRGNFRLSEIGDGKLFLENIDAPFIYVEKTDTYIIMNATNREQTEEYFKMLREEWE